MKDFDTIKSLAEKIAALCADGSTTYGERAAAKGKLERLLARHKLTLDDLASEKTFTFWQPVSNPGERQLFLQCAFFVLGVTSISVMKASASPPGQVGICEVTAVQIADIRLCYGHYYVELQARLEEIEAELKTLKAAKKVAAAAIIAKNDIYPPADDEGRVSKMSPAQMAALIKAMQGLKPKRWERPAGKVEDGVFALTNDA